MSEIHAALLNVAIERFPQQAKQREAMANYMDEALSEVSGVRVLRRDARHTTRSFYRYIFAIDPDEFGATHEIVSSALEAEGIPSGVGYPPMHHYDLFNPSLSNMPVAKAHADKFNFDAMNLPEAERAGERESVWLDERIFRAEHADIDIAIDALKKIQNRLSSDPSVGERIRQGLGEIKDV